MLIIPINHYRITFSGEHDQKSPNHSSASNSTTTTTSSPLTTTTSTNNNTNVSLLTLCAQHHYIHIKNVSRLTCSKCHFAREKKMKLN